MEENRPHVLVFYENNINSVLQQPLTHTQRIKYISHDVSQSYIILGASSGGLYVFRREPCVFIQIIPNQEGAVEHISISPNEKYVCISTSKKCLCIIQLNNLNKSTKVIYRDSFEYPVRSLKWNIYSTELFLGDTIGQISVIIIADFLTNTVFQPSCYPLMRLDSEIVQLDWNSTLLLVSTLSRCYICDTEREEYRQVGQKLRDGDYGGCFINRNESDTSIVLNSTENRKKGWFTSKTLDNKKNPLLSYSYYQLLKIFCSRPGGRLWEVQIDGTVFRTILFKDACQQPLSDIIIYNYSTDLRLNLMSHQNNVSEQTYSVNFSKLYVIKKQFIITYKKYVLYILDPDVTSVIAWCNCLVDIQDISVVDSYIYILDVQGNILCIHLIEIEKLLLRSFINKQYIFCADLCIKYHTNLLNLIPKSNKLYLISTLCEKLDKILHADLIEHLEPFIKLIKDETTRRQNSTSKDVGNTSNKIVTIDNIYYNVNKIDKHHGAIVIKPQEFEKHTEETKKVFPQEDIYPIVERISQENILNYSKMKPVSMPTVVAPFPSFNKTSGDSNLDILYEYFKLSKISKVLNCISIDNILLTYPKIDDVHEFVLRLQTHINKIEEETSNNDGSISPSVELWCFNVFLRFIEIKKCISIISECFENDVLKNYLIDSFIALNISKELACKCDYPLPNASQHFKNIRYMEIGINLVELLWKNNDRKAVNLICSQVPYMWKEVIHLDTIAQNISLLIQFNDCHVIETCLKLFDNNQIRELLNCFIKLQQNQRCLFCDNEIDKLHSIFMNWTQFGLILLKVLGAEITIKYLMEYSNLIPSGSLGNIFYQLCILAENEDTINYYTDLAEKNSDMLMKSTEDLLLAKILNSNE